MNESMTLPAARRRVRTRRALTVAGAAAAALAVWAMTHSIGGTQLAVRSGGSVHEIGAAVVVLTALLAGLAGWGLLAWFERATGRPYRTWRLVAVAVFVVSLAGPLGGVGTGARLALAAMHLVVATVLIAGLPVAGRH
jgi:ribose/xylose/arabinose/galactoside ABC-type transport system permease subunit